MLEQLEVLREGLLHRFAIMFGHRGKQLFHRLKGRKVRSFNDPTREQLTSDVDTIVDV
jgi:hypothetical protein